MVKKENIALILKNIGYFCEAEGITRKGIWRGFGGGWN